MEEEKENSLFEKAKTPLGLRNLFPREEKGPEARPPFFLRRAEADAVLTAALPDLSFLHVKTLGPFTFQTTVLSYVRLKRDTQQALQWTMTTVAASKGAEGN